MKRENMKLRGLIPFTLLLLTPLSCFATWQVAKPQAYPLTEPFFQAGKQTKPTFLPPAYSNTAFPAQYANMGPRAPQFAASISGSLKDNLERIMSRYHWKVVWKAPYDYNFDGKVTGSSLPNVIEKILKPFPLQAVMYNANRTLAISLKS